MNVFLFVSLTLGQHEIPKQQINSVQRLQHHFFIHVKLRQRRESVKTDNHKSIEFLFRQEAVTSHTLQ